MYKDIEDIKSVIASDRNLCQMLDNVDDISIIEWDGNYIYGSQSMSLYFEENHISKDKIKEIYLLGKKNVNILQNIDMLKTIFPEAIVVVPGKTWKDIKAGMLAVHNTFVVHMASCTLKSAKYIGKFNYQEKSIINETRCAYYAVVGKTGNGGLFDNTFSCYVKDTLSDFDSITWKEVNPRTPLCSNKSKVLTQLEAGSSLSNESVFSSYIDELKNGCAECTQCTTYGKAKQCPEAQMAISLLYRNGYYVPKNEIIAHQWTAKAAKQGYVPAILQTAKDECDGYGCQKNIAHAVNYLNAFAKKGYEECARLMIHIIDMNQNNNSFKHVMAVPYIVSLAESNDEEMAKKLSHAFMEEELGLPLDEEQYNYWASKIEHTPQTNKKPTDEEKYQEYLQKAEEGDLRCIELVCEEYYKGKYLPKDYNKSVEWGKKALDKGSKDVRFRLAWLLDGQDGVEPDYEKSYQLYSELAKEGDSSAMNNLGWMYSRGHFVEKNSEEAFDWYMKAAQKGCDVSMCNVADMLWNGKGVEQNQEEAVKWYQKAVDAGLDSCLITLGFSYETGKGVTQDYEKAIEYYRRAADKDNMLGFYNLGIMYYYGKGVDKNTETAIYWYRKAAAKGYVMAKNKLKELNTNWVDENGKVTNSI